jgi:hypothetical protein
VHVPLAPTNTTLGSDVPASVYGQPVTLTASVAPRTGGGTPTGEVVFTDGTAQLGTTTLDGSGQAELIVSDLAVGPHSIVATYSGDDVFDGSASPALDQPVSPGATASRPAPSSLPSTASRPGTRSRSRPALPSSRR